MTDDKPLTDQFQEVWDRMDAQKKVDPVGWRAQVERIAATLDMMAAWIGDPRVTEENQRVLEMLFPDTGGVPPWRLPDGVDSDMPDLQRGRAERPVGGPHLAAPAEAPGPEPVDQGG